MATLHDAHREQVGAINFARIDGDQIDLVPPVHAPHVAGRSRSVSAHIHDYDAALLVDAPPFALDAIDPIADLKSHVIAPVFGHRLEDRNAQSRSRKLDFKLSYRPLDIRRLHEHMFASAPDGKRR